MTGLHGARCSVEYRLPLQEELQLGFLPILLVALHATSIVSYRFLAGVVSNDDESRPMSRRDIAFLLARHAGHESMHDVLPNSHVFVRPLGGRFVVVQRQTRAARQLQKPLPLSAFITFRLE
eukprot:TRINITY_DN28209_c0_g1_i1.p1 TRINITY_DN28209_c0_g1~~TRINITY_DN28209_c0_g1_i1.p1  ORF type:complete len:122 (-),score=6.49 TRINITY_DN28209_c0_g1_i1:7-372(-)